MIGENQVLNAIKQIVDEEITIFNQINVINPLPGIPDTTIIPLEDKNKWIKIENVICVYVDMIGSTKLSAKKHDKSTASAYQLFTNTAVRIFHEFEAKYIDIKGDGIFALFDDNQTNTALASAVTFKTFVEEVFIEKYKNVSNIEIGTHIGIDRKSVLVRKIGLKRKNGRTDRQNEVWAGKPINMAAKLASLTRSGELLVSNRYYNRLNNSLTKESCGCNNSGVKTNLWSTYDLTDNKLFDFERAYLLKSIWCSNHGKRYCEDIIKLDNLE